MIHYLTFSVLDESENISNALEHITPCIKLDILDRRSLASFFEKEKKPHWKNKETPDVCDWYNS